MILIDGSIPVCLKIVRTSSQGNIYQDNFAVMNQLFNIFRVDAVRASEIEASTDEPHIHDFEELIVEMQGII